jgi:integrase
VELLFKRLALKGLTPATVDSVRRTLRAALNDNARMKENPVRRAKMPRVPRHEIDPNDLWTHAEAKRFLAYAATHDADMAMLVRLALDSGARLGELLGLRWFDVKGTSVRFARSVSTARLPGDEAKLRFDTPKNDKARTIQISAETAAALVAIRERQMAEPIADVGQLVFRRPTRQGFQPWRPDVTTHSFQKLAGSAGVPVTPFHYLRHCCASWLLGSGMDVVAVSDRLGHWSPSLTLTVYSHAIRGKQAELARAIGDALK